MEGTMSELINIGLYGDGSRNARRRAEYIYCDSAQECSAYKEGKCFRVTTLFGCRCELGTVMCVDGGTKQSKRFRTLTAEVKAHEKYAQLSYPSNVLVTRIGEKALLTIPHIRIKEQDGKLWPEHPGFCSNSYLVESNMLTPENIKKLCDFHPRALMGGVITDYQEKTVPMFLYQMKQIFPDKYAQFVDEYPDYKIKAPDWKGRYAKLATCNREKTYFSGRNEFRFEGDWLVCDNYDDIFTPFTKKPVEMQVKVTDDMKVKITDNEQVLPDTVFC